MSDWKTLQDKLSYDKTFDCVQCGYCLPACPTYETMEKETHSPRGRINLVKMAAEGKIALEELEEPIEKCLGCMACTSVCPTNVDYASILEGAKETLASETDKTPTKTENFLFETFFPSSQWMNRLGSAAWLYQKTGLQTFAQKLKLTQLAPFPLSEFEKVLPAQTSPSERKKRSYRVQPPGKKQATAAFFTGCVMDGMFFDINQKTIELLRLSGVEVVIPSAQTCCGALHAHSGKAETAKALAMDNIRAFEEEEIDFIVTNAGGCGARLSEYDMLFEESSEWHKRAHMFTEKVKDISEVLVMMDGLSFQTSVKKTITYQPSCHMTNVQKVTHAPWQLIEQIPGISLREMSNPDFCCGSAGIYNMVHYEESMDILDKKMKDVNAVQPEVIVTTNPGCLLQMKLGIEREEKASKKEAIHLVELLMTASPQAKEPASEQEHVL
ncbi:glycolate oxidase iron-sulfur subunit [Alteribacillus persepolensis]|uniref:Glycolate oxidase iron-sulfur subunit n=1 Tax=Alteribacillus persepolensis TaxID=568899 RepID=A0A1G8JRB1_9BACI|nr:(Fe-S)-binding protein [Alteribacillus persepolensis]SDI33090.1 glycolate oxidase iron-sulfur subunit [Alteribacillus persepolensis]